MEKINIDILDDDSNRPWANIQDDGRDILIGMYEDGKIERKLFFIDRKKLKKLARIINMILKDE